MRVISVNTNGIRAAARKGFFDWLPRQRADIVCVQETKAQVAQLDDPLYHPKNFHCSYYDALKKGYAGTAIYSRHAPQQVIRGYGESEFDNEGRYLEYQIGAVGDFAVRAVGFIRRPSPGIQVALHGQLPAAPAGAAPQTA